jgi:hypothetical protein
MKKVLLVTLTLAMAVAGTSSAVDMTGKYGLGFWTQNSAVGGRYWVNDKVGIDVGVGFTSDDDFVNDTTGAQVSETRTDFSIDGGLLYVVFPTDRANFFVRPGITFMSEDVRVSTGVGAATEFDSQTTFMGSLTLGGEVFFGDHFTLSAGHGLRFMSVSPPGDGDSQTTFGTFGSSITNIGFHFYFK